jgi:hypothetical protein
MRIVAIVGCALLLGGCATAHKTYQAPSDAKVKATQKVLTEKVAQARATATKAREATLKAQAEAKELIALAAAVKDKLAVLKAKVPAELQPLVKEIQDAATAQEQKETQTRTDVDSAVALNEQLMQHQKEEETARMDAVIAANQYAGAAAGLAQDATNEREYRIAAEKQLLKQKILGWLWKIGGGAVVVLIIVLIVLWFTGKLAFKFAK